MASDLKYGKLVFAKMRGFPFWPGIITTPTKELKKPPASSKRGNHCIFFFGSRNYSWIEADNLKDYDENKDELCKAIKTASFRKACEEIEFFAKKGLSITSLTGQDPFDKLMTSTSSTTSGKKKSLGEESYVPILSKRRVVSFGRQSEIFGSTTKRRSIEPLSVEKEGKKQPARSSFGRLYAGGRLSELNIPQYKEKNANTFEDVASSGNKGSKRSRLSDSITTVMDRPLSSMKSDDSLSFLSHSSLRTVRAESPPLNLEVISETLTKKNIKPSPLKFGFLGLGKVGSGLVKNLLNSDHKVTVWNRTQEKSEEFIKTGASLAMTPGDVVAESDITFCCVSDNLAANQLIFGNCGVLPEIKVGKSFVEMSGIDAETSKKIDEAVTGAGGRYLEVRFQGSKSHAEEGFLVLMAAGERSLYDDCDSCFSAFSIQKTFLGEVGKASTLFMILHSILGTVLTGLSEVLAMSEQLGIPPAEMLDLFEEMSVLSPFVLERCRAVMKGKVNAEMPLKYLQKDMEMALQMGNNLDQKTTLAANANEHLKYCKSLGYKDLDIGALFLANK